MYQVISRTDDDNDGTIIAKNISQGEAEVIKKILNHIVAAAPSGAIFIVRADPQPAPVDDAKSQPDDIAERLGTIEAEMATGDQFKAAMVMIEAQAQRIKKLEKRAETLEAEYVGTFTIAGLSTRINGIETKIDELWNDHMARQR